MPPVLHSRQCQKPLSFGVSEIIAGTGGKERSTIRQRNGAQDNRNSDLRRRRGRLRNQGAQRSGVAQRFRFIE
jgi:hypothetical protein